MQQPSGHEASPKSHRKLLLVMLCCVPIAAVALRECKTHYEPSVGESIDDVWDALGAPETMWSTERGTTIYYFRIDDRLAHVVEARNGRVIRVGHEMYDR